MSHGELVSAIRDIYEASVKKPVLLSYLGLHISKRGFALPAGFKLKEFVERFVPGFFVEKDVHNELVYHVVRRGDDLGSVSCSFSDGMEFGLDRFYRSVLVAFCRNVDEGFRVYINRDKPYRFEVSSFELGEGFVVVDDEFRLPGLFVGDLQGIPEDRKGDLLRNIVNWAKRHDVLLGSLFWKQKLFGSSSLGGRRSALKRFIQAQRPDMLDKILMPLDIVDILSRHE
jgi:hypothetical protein